MAASEPWPTLGDDAVRRFVTRTFGHARRTQDSPVASDVWISLIRRAERTARARHQNKGSARKKQAPAADDLVDILLTPWNGASPGEIAAYLRDAAEVGGAAHVEMIALNSGFVVAMADLAAIVTLVIPMTPWWQKLSSRFWSVETDYRSYDHLEKSNDPISTILRKCNNGAVQYFRFAAIAGLVEALHDADVARARRLIEIVEKFAAMSRSTLDDDRVAKPASADDDEPDADELMELIWPFEIAFGAALSERLEWKPDYDFEPLAPAADDVPKSRRRLRKVLLEPHVFSVDPNRPAAPMLFDSRRTVKADAAQRLFEIDTGSLTYAVIDGGIDALHPGFLTWSDSGLKGALAAARNKDSTDGFVSSINVAYGPEEKRTRLRRSRILKTYDFTRLRNIQAAAQGAAPAKVMREIGWILDDPSLRPNVDHLRLGGRFARDLDWTLIEPLIAVPHDETYQSPLGSHGTHVAGILAARLDEPEDISRPLLGMCPDLRLYDLRVFDAAGNSDEFTILSAIEFVGWLNRNREYPVIHGANLSLALRHYVDSFACGRTPICEACNRLVNSGTVVVAAAGNTGFDAEARQQSMGSGYRSITITDPGNADGVITVGSTHRRDPHAYGVSYFSSRGPTGDGRRKPDLVAPGEKITSTVPGGKTDSMDGTSMAAPHVSGAAVLLMARYPELIGQPDRIKDVLMRTATDLGRERDFQGAGLLDVLRALQSV